MWKKITAVVAMLAALVAFLYASLFGGQISAIQAAASTECTTTPGVLPGGVPQPYNSIFTAASAEYRIDPALLAAVFLSEHANAWPDPHGPWATSHMGANGPFQFLIGPRTAWDSYSDSNPNHPAGDVQSVTDAAYAAAHYLADSGGHVDMPPGDPNNPLRGTVAFAAGSYNGGTPKTDPDQPGYGENHPYMINAVAKYLELKGGSFTPAPENTGGNTSAGSVYVLGDSIALGARQELAEALNPTYSSVYINASQNRSITLDGVTSGNQTSGLDAVEEDAHGHGSFEGIDHASAIIIELGTNDLHGGQAFETRIRRLINAIRDINENATLYWVKVFTDSDRVDKGSLNTSIENLSTSKRYEPIETNGKGITLDSDGIHPAGEGNQKFAQAVAGTPEGIPNDTCAPLQGNPDRVSAAELARNPNIVFTHPGPELSDLATGRVSPRLIALLSSITTKHKIGIFALASDHHPGTNHEAGRAVDIWMVDGDNCYPPRMAGHCWELAQELDRILGCLHPTELIYYFDPGPSPDSFARDDHDDHIHVGYDGPLGPKHYSDGLDPCSPKALTGTG